MNKNKLLFGGCFADYNESDRTLFIREITTYGRCLEQTIEYDEYGRVIKNHRRHGGVVTYEYDNITNRLIKEVSRNSTGNIIAIAEYYYDENLITRVRYDGDDGVIMLTQTANNNMDIIYEEVIYPDGCQRLLNEYNDNGILVRSESVLYNCDQAIHSTVMIFNKINGHLIDTEDHDINTVNARNVFKRKT